MTSALWHWAAAPRKIRDGAALEQYLSERGAYIAQASTYSYCRARTGFMGPKLFHEQPFLASLEITRWEALHAVLADLFVICEGVLRPLAIQTGDGQGPAALREALLARYRGALNAHGPAPHHPEGWEFAVEALGQRLRQMQLAAPRSPDLVGAASGKVIFDHLPFHEDMLRFDEEMVVNSVRFRILRFWEDLHRRLDGAAVTADLLRGPPGRAQAPGQGAPVDSGNTSVAHSGD